MNKGITNEYYEELLIGAEDWADHFGWLEGIHVAWMNPPFSELGKWVEKASKESTKGMIIVGCVPDVSNPVWFRKWVWNHASIILRPDKRLGFINPLTREVDNQPNLEVMFPVWTPWRAPTQYVHFNWKEENEEF